MIRLDTKDSLVPPERMQELADRLAAPIEQMRAAASSGYDDVRASINLPVDQGMLEWVEQHATTYQDIDTLVVIGIGGSNLGALAVHHAVQGTHHNLLAGPTVLFADTVDTDKTADILDVMISDLRQGKRVLINAISKSGTTAETIALLFAFITELKKHTERWQDHVVITTGEGSALQYYATENDIFWFDIPEKAGGRYSVLTPVGLFPLAVMGVDIQALCEGAADMRKRCLADFAENPATQSAAAIYHHYREGKPIHDHFLFATDMERMGSWYRQLLAESVGKEHDREGNVVHAGITPTVSIGSTDLHSMAQLFLGGPHDKSWTIVTVDTLDDQPGVPIPDDPAIDELVADLRGKDLPMVLQAIRTGVMRSFQKLHRPFIRIRMPDLSAYSIGEFLQLKMCEVMYLADLMHLNAFDQPAVEHYKIASKQELAQMPQRASRLILGADHAGYALKEQIKAWAMKQGLDVVDVGGEDPHASDDYPVYAHAAVSQMQHDDKAILICGTGTGMVIAANKHPGVRAQVGSDAYSARMGRRDNDTNVLCLRAREQEHDVLEIVQTWLTTPFSEEARHVRRIKEVAELEWNE